jgi:hypothetical protein
MPPAFTVLDMEATRCCTRLCLEILRLRKGRILIYGRRILELRSWRTPTLVLALYQHALEIHQFFHLPFSEE